MKVFIFKFYFPKFFQQFQGHDDQLMDWLCLLDLLEKLENKLANTFM